MDFLGSNRTFLGDLLTLTGKGPIIDDMYGLFRNDIQTVVSDGMPPFLMENANWGLKTGPLLFPILAKSANPDRLAIDVEKFRLLHPRKPNPSLLFRNMSVLHDILHDLPRESAAEILENIADAIEMDTIIY